MTKILMQKIIFSNTNWFTELHTDCLVVCLRFYFNGLNFNDDNCLVKEFKMPTETCILYKLIEVKSKVPNLSCSCNDLQSRASAEKFPGKTNF